MVRLAFTIKQAAQASCVKEDDIVKAIRSGELTSRVIRNKAVILRPDLETWLRRLPCWETHPSLRVVDSASASTSVSMKLSPSA